MGERSIVLSLSIAVIAVGVSFSVAQTKALPWEEPSAQRYPHLGVPMRNGDVDFGAVEIQFSEMPSYTMTIPGDGNARIVIEFNADRVGTFEFQVQRASVERWLDALDRLDYMCADATMDVGGCSLATRHRLRLSIGGRSRRITMPSRSDSILWDSTAHEIFWNEFEAVVACIKEDCNVSQWIGSGRW